jgi:hypothetical protein
MAPVSLIPFQDFDPRRINFSNPYTIHPRDDTMTPYQKVYIQVDNDANNQSSDLIINTPQHLMSFGIQEKKDKQTQQVISYQVPLILWNKKGATQDEKQFTNTLMAVGQQCQDFIHDHYDVNPDKLNLLSWRSQENGQEYPMLYVKLITNRKTNRIMTLFINEDTNEEIDPHDLINKRCLMTAAIKIENLYVGDNISLQIKLYEVLVKFIDRRKRNVYQPVSLLRPHADIQKKKTVVEPPPASTNMYSVLDTDGPHTEVPDTEVPDTEVLETEQEDVAP